MGYVLRSGGRRSSVAPYFLTFILSLSGAPLVFAGPEGGEVTNGDGSITQVDDTTIINQLTDRLTIDWRSFDVDVDERVEFIQPDENSIALNRINSHRGSEIHGSISSNGQIILMNPHGIFFGKSAVLNVGGIVTTGLSIDPDDFMNGDFTFNAVDGTNGIVINHGLINAASGGSVSLIGQQVENHGVITAELGVVNLGAGNEAVVRFGDERFVGISVTESVVKDGIGVDPAVINTGEINAADGKVLLTASTSRDIFSSAVNHDDMDYGRSVVIHEDGSFTLGGGADVSNDGSISVSGEEGGSVVLLGENIRHSGSIDANSVSSHEAGHIELHSQNETLLTENSLLEAQAESGRGGDIKILGDEIVLASDSVLIASGATGGGEILIGGDDRGENSLVPNSQIVQFNENSELYANATVSGVGGKVIFWADLFLGAHGDINATGIGRGGFVETSSGVVNLDLSVDVSSPLGEMGQWLIDPYDIVIIDEDADDYINASFFVEVDDDDSTLYRGTGDTSYLSTNSLRGALLFGAVIQIETTGDGARNGDIRIVSPINFDSTNESELRLVAHNNISIEANISDQRLFEGSDSLSLSLTADSDTNGSGGITINPGVTISTRGGFISATGNGFTSTGATLTTDGGLVNLDSVYENEDSGEVFSGAVAVGNITTGGGNFSASGDSFTSTGAALNVSSTTGGGNISIETPTTATNGNVMLGAVNLGNTGGDDSANTTFRVTGEDVIFAGAVEYGVNATNTTGDVVLTVNARDDITVNENIRFDNEVGRNALTVNFNAGSSDGVITINNGAYFWLTGGSFSATGHDFILNGTSAGNDTFINTEGGALNFGASSEPLTGTFNSSSVNTHLSSYTSTSSGNISIYAAEDVLLGDFRLNATTDSNDSGDFNFIVSAGDDVIFNTDIALGYLGGTGENALTVTAGNNNAADGDDQGIVLNAEISVGTAGSFNYQFNGAIDDENDNPTSFTNNTHLIHSNGGNIEIFVDGDVTLQGDVNTLGGAFTVGGNAMFPSSFDNYVGDTGVGIQTSTIVDNVASGDITITTTDADGQGNVILGTLQTQSLTSTATMGGNVTVTSGNDITLQNEFNFSDTGTGANGDENDDTSSITLSLNADNDITLNAQIYDSEAGDQDTLNVALNAGGIVDINGDIYTGGGNLDIQSARFNSEGRIIRTGWSNATGGGNTTTGGHVDILATGNVELGTINTENGYDGGYLSVITDGQITQGDGSFLDVSERATFNANRSNDMSPSSIILDSETNVFESGVAIVDAQDATVVNSNGGSDSDNDLVLYGTGSENVSRIRGDAVFTTVNGAIIDEGNLIVTGTTTLTADTDQDITLDNNNDFGGAVSIVNADDIIIHDAGTGDTAGIDFSSVNSENLTVTAVAGAITDSGNIVIRNSRTLTAGGVGEGNPVAVTLDSSGNQLQRVITPFATNVTITDSVGNLIFGAENDGVQSNISGDLTIQFNSTGNNIFHDGGTDNVGQALVSVGGSTSITTRGQNVQLDNNGNVWGTLTVNTSGTTEDAGSISINTNTLITENLNASSGTGSAAAITINVQNNWTATGDMLGASMTVTGSSINNTFVFDSDSTWTSAGTLTINAGDGRDTFEIASPIVATLNGQNSVDTFQIASSTDAFLNGGNGNDVYEIEAANISVPNINGGNQTDSITGLSHATFVNTWTPESTGAGSITNNNVNEIRYTNIENLNGGSAVRNPENADELIGGRDIFNIDSAVTGTIDAQSGDDEINITAQWTGQISGGDGNDEFNIDARVINSGSDVLGGLGNDRFVVNNALLDIEIDGGQGTNTLTLTDTVNVPVQTGGERYHLWTLTGPRSGNVNGASAVEFINIDTINAPDDANDSFVYSDSRVFDGSIAAGEAADNSDNDSILYTTPGVYDISFGENALGVSEIETLNTQSDDNGAAYTLRIESDEDAQASGENGIQHTWEITGINSGTVTDGTNTVTFQNFGNLQGNEADDHFTITDRLSANASIVSIRGTHDAASSVTLVANEANSLSIDNGNNTFTLTGEFDGEVTVGHVLDFYDVHTLNGQGGDTLTAFNQNNTWRLTDGSGANTVGLTVAMGTSPDLITFSGMGTLNGGSSDDYFDISTALTDWALNGNDGADTFAFDADGSITGTGITGGADTSQDRLIARADSANIWALNATDAGDQNTLSVGSTEYVSDFKDIEILEGSDTQADTYNFGITMDVDLEAGAGTGDTANYSNVTGSVAFTVDATWGIETYIGNNDGLTPTTNSTTLTYESATGTTVDWNIEDTDAMVADGINDGTINDTITFININNLTGGEGNDHFYFATESYSGVSGISGVITGGGENGSVGDLIVGRDVDTTWSVVPAAGNASFTYENGLLSADAEPVPLLSTTQFTGFESINSGSGDDAFSMGSDLAAGEVLRLNGGAGNNSLTLPDSDQPITLGSANDGLSVQRFATITAFATRTNSLTVNSSTNDIVTWEIESANSGRVQAGSGADWVAFNNFQQLIGGDGNDTFDFNSTTSSVVRSGNGSIDGNGGSNTLILRERDNTIEVSGAQSGSVRQTGQGSHYIEQFYDVDTISGYVSSDDDFSVTSTGAFTGVFNGDRSGDRNGTGEDTLSVASVSNEANVWNLRGDALALDSIQRINSSGDATSFITFSQMSQLSGGTGTDHFILMAVGDYSGSINANNNIGGTDIDILDVSNISGSSNATWQTNAVQVGTHSFQNIEQFIGDGASQLTSEQGSATTWRIGSRDANSVVITDADGVAVDGANDGEARSATGYLQFVNVDTFTGADTQVDNFILQSDGSITGTMQGGTGTNISDTLTTTTAINNSEWILSAAHTGTVNGNNFSGIEQLTANGTSDSLRGFSQVNRWEVSGINSGSVGEWQTDSASANETAFIGMEQLIGDAGRDVFDILASGQVTGSILGTADNLQNNNDDRLIVRSSDGDAVTWTLNVDTDTNTTAQVVGRVQTTSLIETLVGGAGRDIFDVENAAVTIAVDGGEGSTDSIRLGGADQNGYTAEATWQINGGDNETVRATGFGTVTFSNIEQAHGTNLRDIFSIADNVFTEIYGRNGNDQFTIVTDTVTDINTTVDGGAGENTLVGGDRTNNWIIGGINNDEANTLNYTTPDNRGVVFTNMQTLRGGALADTFELREGTSIALEGGSGNNTLSAPHDSSTVRWEIIGVNTGEAQWSGINTSFLEIQNLTGGVGLDQFIFIDNDGDPNTEATARLTGLINGGDVALTNPVSTDPIVDTLDVSVFTDGVVVELGPIAAAGTVVEGTGSLPNINAYNIEEIRAAEHDPETGENNNWLAINEANVVIDWDLELADDNDPVQTSELNEGVVQHITSLLDPTEIENTATHFFNFGSLQGYQGEGGQEQSNIIDNGGNITGTYIAATGERNLIFTNAPGQVIVDITPLVLGVQGNADTLDTDGNPIGNTLIRIAPDSEFNGDNAWVINGENAGSFNADYFVDEDGNAGFDFNFSGVNQLQGGTGNDTFTFAYPENTSQTIGLRDGTIDGGPGDGVDQILVTRASDENQNTLVFGVNGLTDPVTVNPQDPNTHIFPEEGIQGPLHYVINREGVIDIAQVDQLIVSDGSVELRSADIGSANWQLGLTETGSALTSVLNENAVATTLEFSGVQTVSGGSADDTFNVQRLGVADSVFPLNNIFTGGDGSDTVNLSGVTNANTNSALTISLNEDDADIANVIVDNIETLTLTGSGHRLIARDVVNRWTINSENAGNIAFGSGDTAQQLSFSSIDHLVGGDVQDTFTFTGDGQFSGTIDGAANTVLGDAIIINADVTNPLIIDITERDAEGNVLSATIENAFAVEGIETFTGNADRATNTTLIGANENTLWTLTGVNAGQFSYTDNQNNARTVAYSDIANITGGTADDGFVFTRDNGVDDGVTGLLNGGAGDGIDTVMINGLSDLQTVALSATREADVNLVDIEILQATAGNNYQLLGDNTTNRWEIDGVNAGEVAGVAFENFATLVGGNANDTFVLDHNENIAHDDQITGTINGGVQPETGSATDTIDATGLQNALVVTLDETYTQAESNVLTIANIDEVNATVDDARTNLFVGGNTTMQNWTINNRNAGSVSGVDFTGFNALLGRNQVDVFSFEGAGTITGNVNGGSQPENTRDVVDVSLANNANVIIGSTTNGFENIEEYRGNNTSSILQAQNIENAWSLTDMNGGTIVDEAGNNIAFSGFANLVGGSDVDRFTLEGGGVTGDIQAGDGDDRLTVDLGNGINGEVSFEGQDGNDTVVMNGGSAEQRFDERYQAIVGGTASHEYEITQNAQTENEETTVYAVNYNTVENVNDNVFVDTLTVQSLANVADTIRVGDQRFVVTETNPDPENSADWPAITLVNANSMNVDAELGDQLIIDGIISLTGDFTANNASVISEGDTARIAANRSVQLNGTGQVGAENQRLVIDTNAVEFINTRDAVYVDLQGGAAINALQAPSARIDIVTNGELTDGNVLNSSNEIIITSTDDIVFDNENNLTGQLTLITPTGNVTLNNGLTEFAQIEASNAQLYARSSMSDGEAGVISVSGTTSIDGLDSSAIEFNNNANAFNTVQVANAGSVSLTDSSASGITLQGNVQQRVVANADAGITVNSLTANDILLTATNGSVVVQDPMSANRMIQLSGEGVTINGELSVLEIQEDIAISVSANAGDLILNASINSPENSVVLNGTSVSQNENATITAGSIDIDSTADTTLMADITAGTLLDVMASGGSLTMQSNVIDTQTEAETIRFFAQDDITTEALTASNIEITSETGRVNQNSTIDTNVITINADNGEYALAENAQLNARDGSAVIRSDNQQLLGNITGTNADVSLAAFVAMDISGSVSATNLTLDVDGETVMNGGSTLNAIDTLTLIGDGNIQLGVVSAGEEVRIETQSAVIDNNMANTNITAPLLTVRSENGFGSFDANDLIETNVSTIDIANNSGTVGISNNGELTVNALLSNGNIRLNNTNGDVILNNVAEVDYDRTVSDAREAGGVINGNYDLGNVVISIPNGALSATGATNARRPDIVGDVVTVSTSGGFGTNRQIVVLARTELIISGRGLRPVWAFNDRPEFGLTTDGDLIDPLGGNSVNDLIVEVEEVADINPAVFTEVRNYVYDDISIRMPRDQVYDYDEYYDDEDEDDYY